MRAIPQKTYQRLKRHYAQSRCAYCGQVLDVNNTTRDHIQPRYRMRKGLVPTDHTERNIVLACMKCNTSKGDDSAEQWGIVLGMAWIKAFRVWKEDA